MGPIASVVALVVLALGTVVLVGVDPNALCLLPVLVLATPLLLRRYPGAGVLASRSDERRSRWSLPTAAEPYVARVRSFAPRGGELIARSLAVRPPPPLFAAS